jgi:hypothetical protein
MSAFPDLIHCPDPQRLKGLVIKLPAVIVPHKEILPDHKIKVELLSNSLVGIREVVPRGEHVCPAPTTRSLLTGITRLHPAPANGVQIAALGVLRQRRYAPAHADRDLFVRLPP